MEGSFLRSDSNVKATVCFFSSLTQSERRYVVPCAACFNRLRKVSLAARRGKIGLTIKGKMDLAPKKPAPAKRGA